MVEAIIKRVLDTVRSNRNVDLISVSGDYGARFICAVLAVDGVPIKVAASCAVTINAKRADGQSKAFEGSVNEDGTVKVPITQWMLEIAHTRTECTVSAVGIDTKLSATPFDIEVAATPHQSEEISPDDPDYDVLVQVLAGEASRNASEAERVKAEEARALAEKERASAETERDQAETKREQAEALRAAAENQREQAEASRNAAEASRNAAEAARVKAEEARASAFLAMDGRISRNEKRVATLEAAVYGDLAQEVEDNSVAYVKDVPSNALSAVKISKIGGMTRKCTNLWDNTSAVNGNSHSITRTETGFSFVRGNLTGGAAFYYAKLFYLGDTVTFTCNGTSYSPTMIIYSDKVYGTQLAVNAGTVSYTFTEDTHAVFAVIINSLDSDNVVSDIRINEGATTLPYEPYFEGLRSAPVTEAKSVGANLIPFPYENSNKTINGIKFTVNADGTVKAKGTATAQADFWLHRQSPIPISAGSYCLSGCPKGGSWSTYVFIAQIDGKNHADFGNGVRFTVSNDTTVRFAFIIYSGSTFDNVVLGLALNKGTTALPYAPYVRHTLPMPEAVQALDGYGWGINESIYNYIDCEKKQFVKRVGKHALTGNDNLTMTVDSEGWLRIGGIPNVLSRWYGGRVISNYYEYTADATGDKVISISDTIYILDSTCTTVEAYKQKFAEWYAEGKPLTFYYSFATPEVTDISDILSADNYIEVEGGGTLTFENEYKYDVPSGVTFVTKEVSE